MVSLPSLNRGDRVAVLSPSFAAPGMFPEVFELGLSRMRDVFGLEPVEFPTTRKLGASAEERSRDLVAAFEDPSIKAVIASIGGDDQVTYVHRLPPEPFARNPKPFFGYSDNSHLANFLWLQGVPSFYGGSIMTQYAMQGQMDEYTVQHVRHALFGGADEVELKPSATFNEVGLGWDDPANLYRRREHVPNEGWVWDGTGEASGVTWGGCLESIDEMLRHAVPIPTLEQFEGVALLLETSEEIPLADYVRRVLRALGERGVLERLSAVLVGRPKAWEFDKPQPPEAREAYRRQQQETIVGAVRAYNEAAPIVQNLEFGHTDPQVPMPYGGRVRVDAGARRLFVRFR
ncbi:MAG: LD-carboxypeptidase [Trueperaceae bacterium]|nr:LD-carboxypeptidase [Trueperaceae bacterium]